MGFIFFVWRIHLHFNTNRFKHANSMNDLTSDSISHSEDWLIVGGIKTKLISEGEKKLT